MVRGNPSAGHLVGDLFRISIFIRILVALWLPFGTLWAPFWSLLAPVGSILVPVGTLWAPFWSLWAPFWLHFQCLGAILVKNNFGGHPISRKTCKLPLATPTKANFRMHPDFPRPGAGILPQATEMRSGPEDPRRVGIGGLLCTPPLHCTFTLHLTLATCFVFFLKKVTF